MRIVHFAGLLLLISSFAVGTSLIDPRLSTIEQVRLVPLLPVYEPLPESPDIEARLRSMATSKLSEHGIEATDSKEERRVLYLQVQYDRNEKACSCVALFVSARLVEPGTLERRWTGDQDPRRASFFSSVTSWQEDQLVLARRENLAAEIMEASEAILTEFAERTAQARDAANR